MKPPNTYLCALATSLLVFAAFQGARADDDDCCGDTKYDPATEECCGGTTIVAMGQCCNGEELEEGEGCCGGIKYNLETESCCDEEQQLIANLTQNETCCGNEVINPSVTESIGYTLSVSELLEKAQEATENISVNGTGCGWSDVGELEVNITGSKRKKCCDYGDGIEASLDIYKVEGSGSFNLGTFACRYNALSATVPAWLAQAYAEVSVSFTINLGNIDFETDCEEPTVCHGPVSGDVDITGCLGGELAQGYAQISCGIEGTGSIGTKLCFGAAGFSLSDQYAQVEDVVIFGQFLVGDIEVYRVEHSLLNN